MSGGDHAMEYLSAALTYQRISGRWPQMCTQLKEISKIKSADPKSFIQTVFCQVSEYQKQIIMKISMFRKIWQDIITTLWASVVITSVGNPGNPISILIYYPLWSSVVTTGGGVLDLCTSLHLTTEPLQACSCVLSSQCQDRAVCSMQCHCSYIIFNFYETLLLKRLS